MCGLLSARRLFTVLLLVSVVPCCGCGGTASHGNSLRARQHLLFAQALSRTGAEQVAANEARLALAADPESPEVKTQAALAAGELGLRDWAAELLAGCAFSPSDRELWDVLINHCYRERRPELVALCHRVLEYDPFDAQVANTLAYFYAEQGTHLQEAEVLAKRALAIAPFSGEILDTVGWVYYRQGRYQEALDYLRRAVEKKGMADVPEVRAHLAATYEALGRHREARLEREFGAAVQPTESPTDSEAAPEEEP